MTTSVNMKWSSGLRFKAEIAGRTVELNSAEKMASAFTPMELFLVSLAGCTSMDIIWILERQRQIIHNLEVSIEGIRRREDPKYYETINLEFILSGLNIRENAVEKAIGLSKDKYCSVLAMLNDSVKVNITYKILDESKPMARTTSKSS